MLCQIGGLHVAKVKEVDIVEILDRCRRVARRCGRQLLVPTIESAVNFFNERAFEKLAVVLRVAADETGRIKREIALVVRNRGGRRIEGGGGVGGVGWRRLSVSSRSSQPVALDDGALRLGGLRLVNGGCCVQQLFVVARIHGRDALRNTAGSTKMGDNELRSLCAVDGGEQHDDGGGSGANVCDGWNGGSGC